MCNFVISKLFFLLFDVDLIILHSFFSVQFLYPLFECVIKPTWDVIGAIRDSTRPLRLEHFLLKHIIPHCIITTCYWIGY